MTTMTTPRSSLSLSTIIAVTSLPATLTSMLLDSPANHIPDLWFPDGNVIIRVGKRLCCVYKGFLASQSPVLSDMFSFPQPKSVDTFMGLPTVAFPDADQDVEHWLKALFVPGYFKNYPEEVDGTKLLAVLRLSHKYDVQYYRRCGLRYLAHNYATDLEGHYQTPRRNTSNKSAITPMDDDLIAESYTLAMEIGALWLIPSMVYNLHVLSYSRPAKADQIAASISHSGTAHLWRIGLLAGTRLAGGFSQSVWPPSSQFQCPGQKRLCSLDACILLCENSTLYVSDPLGFFSPHRIESMLSHHKELQVCTTCLEVLRERHGKKCKVFWETLPEELGLGTWAELRALKARDLGESGDD
ncbi:hypothetical protein BD626DRAFT_596566, partial [Schizophyllum amplum]